MSGHGEPIGQEWAHKSDRISRILALETDQLGQNVHAYQRVLAFFIGLDPVTAESEILRVGHEMGRHADGRCPDRCPKS